MKKHKIIIMTPYHEPPPKPEGTRGDRMMAEMKKRGHIENKPALKNADVAKRVGLDVPAKD
jgi:hypothetical protein